MPMVNSLSAGEWFASYGLYQALIDQGAQTVMAGHILQPALERLVAPEIREADMRPGSLSRNLLTGILRERMGFNGLITTDATPMVGFSAQLTRADAIRTAFMAGADVILFCKSMDEDYQALRDGLESGSVTMEQGEIFTSGVAEMKEKFDLSIVAANVPTGSNYTTRRVDWITLMAANEPWYMKDIPTMFLSFCNPYYMVDVPFISNFVNCYSANEASVTAAVERLMGRVTGVSPVDPWCGAWGAKFM